MDASFGSSEVLVERAEMAFSRTTEQIQRGKLGLLFQGKSGRYKRAILRAKRAHFRRFKTEELDMDRFSAACNVVKGKWKKNVPNRLITSSGGEASIWNDVQAQLAKHHFNQAHDVLENIRSNG